MRSNEPAGIYGVIGGNVDHSLSPVIHNYLFKRYQLRDTYTSFGITPKQLAAKVAAMKILGIKGFNVTFPHKEKIIPLLDRLSPIVRSTGAVNTVTLSGNKLLGDNTDVWGIASTLARHLRRSLRGGEVILLGAGGAARSCLFELTRQKVGRVWLFNRSADKAEQMVQSFSKGKVNLEIEVDSLNNIRRLKAQAKPMLLINASSAERSVLRKVLDNLGKTITLQGMLVFDLNYGARALSVNNRPAGVKYLDGLYLLAAQAAASFRLWTGINPAPEAIYRHLKRTGYRR